MVFARVEGKETWQGQKAQWEQTLCLALFVARTQHLCADRRSVRECDRKVDL